MRRWAISRRQPLQFKPGEDSMPFKSNNSCQPLRAPGDGILTCCMTFKKPAWCFVSNWMPKCSAGGSRGKKLSSWFKLDIASFSHLAFSAAGHPRLSGGQGVRQVFICCPVPLSTLPLHTVTATRPRLLKKSSVVLSAIPYSHWGYPSLNRSTVILEDYLLCSPRCWE